MKIFKEKKSIVFGVAFVIVLSIISFSAIGTTVAYIIDGTESVENTFSVALFEISIVEDFSDGSTVKENVTVHNASETGAYIRAALVINWKNGDGEIYPKDPLKGIDYSLDLNEQWILSSDGYFYYPEKVEAGEETQNLINRLEVLSDSPEDGYTLSVEVLASAVQSEPASAVYDAWGIEADGGILTVIQ